MAEEQERTEDEAANQQEADVVEDLDVPEHQAEDVAGGLVYEWWKKVE